MMVIHNPNTDLFWSNDIGWVDLKSADQYSAWNDLHNIARPMGGFWISYEDAIIANNRRKENKCR